MKLIISDKEIEELIKYMTEDYGGSVSEPDGMMIPESSIKSVLMRKRYSEW